MNDDGLYLLDNTHRSRASVIFYKPLIDFDYLCRNLEQTKLEFVVDLMIKQQSKTPQYAKQVRKLKKYNRIKRKLNRSAMVLTEKQSHKPATPAMIFLS